MSRSQSTVLHDYVQNLEGQLLTVIDASFSDKEQREAQKSILRNLLWDWWRGLGTSLFPTQDCDAELIITGANGTGNGMLPTNTAKEPVGNNLIK